MLVWHFPARGLWLVSPQRVLSLPFRSEKKRPRKSFEKRTKRILFAVVPLTCSSRAVCMQTSHQIHRNIAVRTGMRERTDVQLPSQWTIPPSCILHPSSSNSILIISRTQTTLSSLGKSFLLLFQTNIHYIRGQKSSSLL